MTKRELIEWLEDYDDDQTVLICMGTDNKELLEVFPDDEDNNPVLSCLI